MFTRYRFPSRLVQPVTWLSRALPALSVGVTSVALVSANRYRCPDKVPIQIAPPPVATHVGTSSLGKFMGLGSRQGTAERTSIWPLSPTLVSVFDPESATNKPLLVASTSLGLASCSCVPGHWPQSAG